MSVALNSPLTSANTNGAFVSRTVDTSMVGKLDQQNVTDATASTNGALHTQGGMGVEKSLFVGADVTIESHLGAKALANDGNGKIIESATSAAELDLLVGATSNIQTQIDNKADNSSVVHNTGNESVAGIKTFTDDLNANANMYVGLDLTVDGNLTVNGTTTTVNTATLDVTDTNITVNNTGNDATSEGAGLTVDRTGTNGSLIYENALASRFKAGDLGSESEIITAATAQTMSGAKTFTNKLNVSNELNLTETVDSTTTGANATVPTLSPSIRLTNASLTSVANIDDVTVGKFVVITNDSGASVIFNNNSGGTAIKRIITGTGADLSLADGASLILSYSSSSSRWCVVGGSGSGGSITYQEVPTGTVDGVNATFGPLTFVPSSDDSILVSIDGVIVPRSDYSVSVATITFGGSSIPQVGQSVYCYYATGGAPALPSFSGIWKTEYRTLTGGEATAKQITLATLPSSPSDVMLDVIGGGAQFYGDDFTVSGSVLSWSGLGLDGVLVSGDKLRVGFVN